MVSTSKSSQSHSQALCRNRPLNYPLHVRFKDVQRKCQFIEDAKALLHVIACYCMLLHVIACYCMLLQSFDFTERSGSIKLS